MNTATAPTPAPGPAPVGARTVALTVDGRSVTVPEKTTVLEAARRAGVTVPILCHKDDLNPVAVCRVCAVMVKDDGSGRGERVFAASCTRECRDKMVVETGVARDGADADAARVGTVRKTLVELLLAEHPVPCKRHKEFGDCELEVLGEKLGLIAKPPAAVVPVSAGNGAAAAQPPVGLPVFNSPFTPRAFSKGTDFSNPSIAIDHAACILCDRCVRACTDVAHNNVIGRAEKGTLTAISFDDDRPMGDSSCVNCGWCMVSCPTGAITYSGGVQPELPGGQLSVADIKKIPLFEGVSAEFLARSEGGVVVRHFKKGEVLCRQGEYGSTAFYIDSGKVDIYLDTDLSHVRTKRQTGGLFNRVTSLLVSRKVDKRVGEGTKQFIPIDANVDLSYDKPIAQIGEGELLGEAACLNFQPRSATVRAAEDTIVFEMLRNVLDILRRNRRFKAEMERKYRDRALDSHLRSVPVFRDLPQDFINELRDKVELVSFEPGEVVCTQGEVADAFYLVRMGHVKVFQAYADGQGMVLNYMSRSQYFGEIGLLGGGPQGEGRRTATCTALDHVELVRIGRETFDGMTARFPEIRARLQAVAEGRLASDRDHQSKVKRITLQQFIDDGLYEAQSLLILDLEKCTRCDECVRACAEAHNGVSRLIRDGLRYDKYLVTTSCRSCRDPLCMVGCPVGSIRRKNDMQIIIEDHCIGCGRCAEQCPYGNINLHPFDMKLTDPVTGQTRKEVRTKAAVCDLCTDQCLDEHDDPSCVYACPHDAAHRVDGQSFFDLQVLNVKAAGDKIGGGK